MINLVANARDAMPDGGTLTVSTRGVEVGPETPHDDLDPGPYAVVAVRDTGTGMDEETAARAFEPFFTTKDLGRGTGLGLATVHGIVRQSGGHIFVHSDLAEGSTFEVYLPQVDAPVTTQGRVTPVATERVARPETVLLVDDDDLVREATARTLQRAGYTVLHAASATQAAQVASEHRAHLDLLITDVVMPRKSGPELASELRETHPDLEVLYISGDAENAIARDGVLEPGLHFLAKPFAPADLQVTVRRVLDADS